MPLSMWLTLCQYCIVINVSEFDRQVEIHTFLLKKEKKNNKQNKNERCYRFLHLKNHN